MEALLLWAAIAVANPMQPLPSSAADAPDAPPGRSNAYDARGWFA